MTDDRKDPPLEVLPAAGMYVGQVVDLAEARIRQGLADRGSSWVSAEIERARRKREAEGK